MLRESILELQKVTKKIAQLTQEKEVLIHEIIKALKHKHKGQKSYEFEEFKLEVRTPTIYSLDTKLYEELQESIPEEYNPVKETTSFKIDKKLCDEYLKKAPDDVKSLLIDLIEEKPGKANVVVKYRD